MIALISALALNLSEINELRAQCGNACVDAAEASGLCFDEQEECYGNSFEKCLDDCDYDMAETIEMEGY